MSTQKKYYNGHMTVIVNIDNTDNHYLKNDTTQIPLEDTDKVDCLISVKSDNKTNIEIVAYPESKGEVSDGYHTFDELYHHRAILFAMCCANHPDIAWKSKQHDDPKQPMYDGMFIVGLDTPFGQVTYHYDLEPYWDIFKVKELERAPKWDGSTPDDCINRMQKFAESLMSKPSHTHDLFKDDGDDELYV